MRIRGIDKDFPEDAVKNFSPDMRLLTVTGTDGKILWSQPPKVLAEAKAERKLVETGGKSLPPAVLKALTLMLGNAQFQTLRTDEKVMVDFFQGYLVGAHAVLGVIGGALGYDLSWLEEQNDD